MDVFALTRKVLRLFFAHLIYPHCTHAQQGCRATRPSTAPYCPKTYPIALAQAISLP
ncbi:MAG: hypothetical protein RML94_15155 [Bacteroidia bacterium]|nr:hypothetical protein [Bacteroidia bacterium]